MRVEFTGNKNNKFTFAPNMEVKIVTLETTMFDDNKKPVQVRVHLEQLKNHRQGRKITEYTSQLKVADGESYFVTDKDGKPHCVSANWDVYNSKFDNADELNAFYSKLKAKGFNVVANNTYVQFNPFAGGLKFQYNVEVVPSKPIM